jgi:hypothetical protein
MEKAVMQSLLLICSLIVLLSLLVTAPSDAADNQKTESSKGLTIENIGQGLKSAAKNIGDEIPKIGPAIEDTFKKVTGQDNAKEKEPKKSSAQGSKDKHRK